MVVGVVVVVVGVVVVVVGVVVVVVVVVVEVVEVVVWPSLHPDSVSTVLVPSVPVYVAKVVAPSTGGNCAPLVVK